MRGLTLLRPWAGAFFFLGKPVENRGWLLPDHLLGELVALHSGMRVDVKGTRWILDNHIQPPDHPHPAFSAVHGYFGEAERTGIVGVARFVATGRDRECLRGDAEAYRKATEGRWFFGPCGWAAADVQRLERAVPCRGSLGLWRLPQDVERAVCAQLG